MAFNGEVFLLFQPNLRRGRPPDPQCSEGPAVRESGRCLAEQEQGVKYMVRIFSSFSLFSFYFFTRKPLDILSLVYWCLAKVSVPFSQGKYLSTYLFYEVYYLARVCKVNIL